MESQKTAQEIVEALDGYARGENASEKVHEVLQDIVDSEEGPDDEVIALMLDELDNVAAYANSMAARIRAMRDGEEVS